MSYSPVKSYMRTPLDRTAPIYPPPASYGPPPPQYAPQYQYPYYQQPYRQSQYGYQRGEQWSEYIPVEQRYTDYVPETKVEYRPIEKSYTDYIEVKHETDYVPVPRLEKRVEYIPVDRYDEHIDYVPVQNSHVVKGPQSRVSQGSQYLPPAPYSGSYVAPTYAPPPQYNYSRRGGYGYRYL